MNKKSLAKKLSALAIAGALQLVAGAASAQEHVSHGRFADVTLYRPAAEVKSFVLFLSGDGGWNQGVEGMASALAAEGALVAGVDTPKFLASFSNDGTSCVNPDGDLENLSHYLQGYAQLPTYFAPMLVGYSSGATLAYATLAQAGSGTFAGAVTLGFCPDLEIKAQPCHGAGLHYQARPSGKGIDLASTSVLGGPWWALHGEQDSVCDIDATRKFVDSAADATMVSLPSVGHGYQVQRNWLPQLLETYRSAAARTKNALEPPSLPGLPLVEMPTEHDGDLFAVLVSGDGGWAGLDKEVAAGLVSRGIPVVGLDSLRYFWKARTPESFAADLDQILNFYSDHWGKQRAIVIGYSQGADVLPFALNRLSPDANAIVERSVLLAPAESASFEFHLTNWVGGNSGDHPVKPEIERLDLTRLACFYGEDENEESPCSGLDNAAHVQALPGGHHFNGAYSELVSQITAGMSW